MKKPISILPWYYKSKLLIVTDHSYSNGNNALIASIMTNIINADVKATIACVSN
jgi:hypothetical protein